MVKRYNRLLVFLYVISDALAGIAAFLLAYIVRFDTPFTWLVEVTKTTPPFARYLSLAPFVGVLVPVAYQLQGLYRLRRGRTRVDDFFAVLVGSIVAVILGVLGTLYVNTYQLSQTLKEQGYLEVSRPVWVLFLVLNVVFT